MATNPARGDKVRRTIPRELKPESLPNTLTSSQGEVVLVRGGRLYVTGMRSDAFSAMALVAA